MKTFSQQRFADLVLQKRKELNLTQAELSRITGINRTTLSRIESCEYIPLLPQLEALSSTLLFDPTEVYEDAPDKELEPHKPYNVAIAGTGYVGLSIATLLSQHNHVTAVDIIPEKVKLIKTDNLLFRTLILRSILRKKIWILQQRQMVKKLTRMLTL